MTHAHHGRFREADSIARLVGNRPAVDLALLNMALTDEAPGLSADSLAASFLSQAQPAGVPAAECGVALARAFRGDTSAVAPPRPANPIANFVACAWTIDLLRLQRSPEFSRVTLARVDSGYRASFGFAGRGFQAYVLARAWEQLGDHRRALAAIRLRSLGGTIVPASPWLYGEEGRLAALAGDTAGAIRAYRDYLDFTAAADAVFAPKRERVRAELARLTGPIP